MIFLLNDYSEGMHLNILRALNETNEEQQIGYGLDKHSENACNLIRDKIGNKDAGVYLLVGGTQTNRVAITAFLRPIEAIIATNLSHISTHETGAIEASGHRILEAQSKDGKITPKQILRILEIHNNEHMVIPKMVYISNSTEIGTIYTKKELEEIYKTCKENNLFLYMDGARLANALTCDKNDLTLKDVANLTDAFYIGGTKNAAMIGEALVVNNPKLKEHMRYYIKQNGALLAKGRFLGIQFEELMKDDLYLKISKHTNEMGKLLKNGIKNLGYKFVVEVETNLIFVLLPVEIHKELSKHCYYDVEKTENENILQARFVTSWATPKGDVEKFIEILEKITNSNNHN